MIKWYKRLVVFIPIYFVVYMFWMLFINDRLANRFIVSELFFLVGLVIAFVCLYFAYKKSREKEKNYWLFLWIGTFFYIISQIFVSYYESVMGLPQAPTPGWADVFHLLQGLFFLVALLRLKYVKKSYYSVQVIIDILIAMAAGFSIFWHYFLSAPVLENINNWLYMFMAVSYIVLDLGLLFGFLSIYSNRRIEFDRIAGKISAVGFCIYIGADFIYFYLLITNMYDKARWINAVWLLGLMLLGLSGIRTAIENESARIKRLAKAKKNIDYTTRAARSLVPYIAFGILYITVIVDIGFCNSLVFGLAFTGMLVAVRQFSVIIQNNKLLKLLQNANEELKYLLQYNQLTGIYNREFFEEEMHRLEKKNKYPISVLTCDVDGLKLVNDTMGHHQGDKLLITCARQLKQCLRDTDILARIGGDEFAALLPNTDRNTAQQLVNNIKASIEHYNRKNKDLPLSISIGTATADNNRTSLKQLLKEADDKMYHEKLIEKKSSRSQIIDSLMAALAERDYITQGHAQRLSKYCLMIGERLNLPPDTMTNLDLLAQAHDLGKVGVPDSILFKEGKLTSEEWEIMKQHSEKGYRIALASYDLQQIADLIYKHHERWDGKGYPLGLKGEEIPLECRILAVADAYDAMRNDRPHSRAIGKKEAMDQLMQNAGTQFDPEIVKIFLEILQNEKD